MKLTREKCGKLIEEGWTDQQIAEAHNIALRTFQRRRLRWGFRRGKSIAEPLIEEAELRELKAQRKTDAQIGEALGVSATTVKEYRLRWGIPAYGKTAGPAKPTKKQMQALKDQELTDKEIAEKLGFSVYTVSRWRREYDIPGNMSITSRDRFYEENIERVYELRRRGLRLSEIAAEIGVVPETISNWLPKRLKRNPDHVDTDLGKRIVYDWIVWYKAKNAGNSPSVLELSSLTCMSESTVRKMIALLEKQGKIRLLKPARTVLHFALTGEQWLPPSGVKILTQPPTWERPSRSGRKRLINAERKSRKRNGYREYYCDCGQAANHVLLAVVRLNDSRADNNGWIPLCADCTELAIKSKERVLPLSVRNDERIQ